MLVNSKALVILGLLSFCLPPATALAGASTRYVDDDAAPGGDGLSWATAYDTIEDALDELPVATPPVTEIRVAQGVYTPDRGTGDRTLSYIVDGPGGVAIQGGFAGLGAPDPDARDTAIFVTRLTADLLGNDTDDTSTKLDNSHQIMRCLAACTVSGLRFESAYSRDNDSVIISGGAILVLSDGVRIERCDFSSLQARRGGAVATLDLLGTLTISECDFSGNIATGGGGAIYMDGQSGDAPGAVLRLGHSRLCMNRSETGTGGALATYSAGAQITNCAFLGNITDGPAGGAAYIYKNGAVQLLNNCLIAGNTCLNGVGGGVYGSTIDEMNNCIILENRDASGTNISAQVYCQIVAQARNNCIPGWPLRPFEVTNNIGNINTSPRLIDGDGPDDIWGTSDDDIRLRANSPCIDAGTDRLLYDRADYDHDGTIGEPPPVDLNGQARFLDDALASNTGSQNFWGLGPIDIGPTEYQADCDNNLVIDSAQILADATLDLDQTGVLDSCEPFIDCNNNGIRDSLDILLGDSMDCNGDGVPDECSIAAGTSVDLNINGVPDECEHIIIYVNDDADEDGDGRTWSTAHRSLGTALEHARRQQIPPTIRIAGGTFRPEAEGEGSIVTFRIPAGTALEGGYAGTESDPDLRDFALYASVLDADLNGDDDEGLFTDNAAQLVICEGVGETITLSGLQLRGAWLDTREIPWLAGALWLARANLDVSDCRFTDNLGRYAGAIAIDSPFSHPPVVNTSVRVQRSTFEQNEGLISAGGIAAWYSDVEVEECAFLHNTGLSAGGIHASTRSSLVVNRSRFMQNTGEVAGAVRGSAAVTNIGVQLYNCLCLANTGLEGSLTVEPAALVMDYGTSGTTPAKFIVESCTIFGSDPGAVSARGATIRNTIIWDNEQAIFVGAAPEVLSVSGSIFENSSVSGVPGFDPEFVDPLGPDLVPRSGDEDLSLSPGSPAIDWGRNLVANPNHLVDLLGNDRFVNDCATPDNGDPGAFDAIIDPGAYEFQAAPLSGDVTADGLVDVDDLNEILSVWNSSVGVGDPRDLAGNDGLITVDDLNVVLGNWGVECL